MIWSTTVKIADHVIDGRLFHLLQTACPAEPVLIDTKLNRTANSMCAIARV